MTNLKRILSLESKKGAIKCLAGCTTASIETGLHYPPYEYISIRLASAHTRHENFNKRFRGFNAHASLHKQAAGCDRLAQMRPEHVGFDRPNKLVRSCSRQKLILRYKTVSLIVACRMANDVHGCRRRRRRSPSSNQCDQMLK